MTKAWKCSSNGARPLLPGLKITLSKFSAIVCSWTSFTVETFLRRSRAWSTARLLSHLTLPGKCDSELVYLRQAAKCYIFGLPQAAIALARAALEDCLRKKLAKMYGKSTVAQADLKDWIDDLVRTKGLSRGGGTLAHKVRVAANEVLHPDDEVAEPPDALGAIEAARAIIMELSRR